MRIKRNIYENVLNSYPNVPPENGGVLGSVNGVVCNYCHDNSYQVFDKALYTPDLELINHTIKKWFYQGISFAGMVHSHIKSEIELSSGDIEYIKTIYNAFPKNIDKLYFPIVLPEENQLISYVAVREKNGVMIQSDSIVII